ncbi:pyridoxal phosphate-dependent transferase [Pyronema domesticum]|uniref:Similar to Uncharacterized trans-sulfuration enzyme YHR112C acc. no. P38716 n=1 Tax=Pyronema omphalodes (strain CBS 100304) TaxID=1076935 RepID=U4LTU9_PYROM|nr:pyridoxal phosphate-dependent transferase [Pyronema domesticum]CCX31106.1 Similar to Uncharacterized trans-sulfuration enzyme YHR112C; acc. no. P38716 [Pyronema omphalodes CBS 100304]
MANPSPLANKGLSLATLAIHADEHLAPVTDIAPPLHVSTTYRYVSNPDDLVPYTPPNATDPPLPHVYSRLSAPSTSRLESALSAVLSADTIVYPSGLAAFHALLVTVNPKRLLITDGYHGCHGTAHLMQKLTGMEIVPLDTPPKAGDLVHIETPINPTGIATDIASYVAKARAVGATVSVDATFAPPPLQDPWKYDVDWVMHSGSKYFGGHSDMLAGTLSVRDPHKAAALRGERLYLGATMGNMEAWLGLRSIKTLELRVARAAENATKLAGWVESERLREGSAASKVVEKVTHASLQEQTSWLKEQMPNGGGPVWSLLLKQEIMAKTLPSKLLLWGHATSLGGVESLIEWRAMTDDTCDRRLLRLSTGIEGFEDLRKDLETAFEELAKL